MSIARDTLLEIEKIRQFASRADEFCTLLENHQTLPAAQFVQQVAGSLAGLYQAALNLPETESEIEVDTYVLPLEKFRGLGKKLDHTLYWLVSDPFEPGEPAAGDIVDDLMDIYQELKSGLLEYQKGTDESVAGAVWHWRFGFAAHWGRHLVNAQQMLFWMIAPEILP